MNCRTFDELLDMECGEKGTSSRNELEKDAQIFCLATTLKEERQKAGLTQQELAERIGTKENLYIPSGKRKSRCPAQHPLPNL